MNESREVVIRRMEGGRILLDQFIKSAAEKRDAMGLDNSAVAACREVIGNNKAMAVVRRDMIDAYLESIGKGGFNIMDYVKEKAAVFESSKPKCRARKRQEEVEQAVGM